MSRTRLTARARGAAWILVAALAFASPVGALAQTAGSAMPANSSANSFGGGWDCKAGYRKDGNGCELIRTPDNAVLTGTSYGRGWECRRGYLEVRETCVALEIPANAYLSASGVRWECHRGYRETDQTCVLINVPTNAYLTESNYGPGWTCERGFRATGDSCQQIDLPANAYLDYSGNDWECARPYHRELNRCVLR